MSRAGVVVLAFLFRKQNPIFLTPCNRNFSQRFVTMPVPIVGNAGRGMIGFAI